MTDVQLTDRIAKLTEDQRKLLWDRCSGKLEEPPTEPGQAPVGANGSLRTCFSVLHDAEAPSAAELRRYLAERLPEFMIPGSFHLVEDLPHQPNGKLDRRRIAELSSASPLKAAPSSGAIGSPLELQIGSIWAEILGLDEVHPDDNFFDLGGHSLLLAKLIGDIRREFQIELPLRTLFESPTLRELAEIVRSRSARPFWRSLVCVRKGDGILPLYLVHGLGGGIGDYYRLARHLDKGLPVYGLQAPAEPFSELQSMAAQYVEDIRNRQPYGPYFLGGYCLGGCVAFEMARQLVEDGETVELLALIECAPPGQLLRNPASAGSLVANRARQLARKSPAEILGALSKRADALVRRLLRSLSDSAKGFKLEVDDMLDMSAYPEAYRAAAAEHFRALRDYSPRPYSGNAVLFRTDSPELGRDRGWRPLIEGNLDIHVFSGRHHNVFKEPNITDLGARLGSVLRSARENRQGARESAGEGSPIA